MTGMSSRESHCYRACASLQSLPMKHHLDFEKPIAELQRKLDELRKNAGAQPVAVDLEKEIAQMEKKLAETLRQTFSTLTPWQRVQLARHPKRPFTLDYFGAAFTRS